MAGEDNTSADFKVGLYHPAFPSHWKRAPLYSLAKWVNGLAFRDIQFSTNGAPIIKIAEVKDGISSQTKFTEQVFDESVHVHRGDLIFSWSGQPETSIDAFWWRDTDGWLNQHLFRVTSSKEIEQTFFFYLLKYVKPNFIGIARNKQTTGLGHVTKRDLETIEAAYPEDQHEQLAIAHILGTLDDKIELNRRMNETLEAIARTMFKSWFVDFDPVRAKMSGEPPESICQRLGLTPDLLALFPDRLVDFELGEIPEGWSEKRVDDVLELAYGKALKASERINCEVPVYGSGGITGNHNEHLVEGPGVIIGRKGTVGSLYWEDRPFFPIDTVFYVIPKVPLTFCFYLLQTLGLERMNTDAAVPGLNRNNVYRLTFACPTEKLLLEFDKFVRPLRDKIFLSFQESQTLINLRDSLLPKLLSGELRVVSREPMYA